MTEIQTIPLSQLKASDLNARRTGGKKVEELAASIRAIGLQQNLGVVPNGKGYGVVFGGRRLRALQALKKAGELPESLADGIPCKVMTEAQATEASLAENAVREAMNPLDQFQAFQALVDEGKGEAEVAARFGVTEAVVKQRLRLARVSPKLLQAYGAGDMTLEQLQAFAVTEDTDRQEAHWKKVRGHGYESDPQYIRRELLRQEVSGADARVQLIGLQAYVDAGGELRRDLFSDAVVILDVPLLDRLASVHLEQMAEVLRADGWSWVEIGGERPHWNTPKIEGDSSESSQEELAEVDRLEALAEERALTPAELVRLLMLENPVHTAEQKAASGARLMLSSAGYGIGISVYTGLLRDGEEPPVAPPEDEDEDTADAVTTVQVGTHERTVRVPGQPSFGAIQRLQAEATAIVQLQVTKAPHIALALLVAELASDLYSGYGGPRSWLHIGQTLSGRAGAPLRSVMEATAAGAELGEMENDWRKKLPAKAADLSRWAVDQDTGTLLQLLAHLVAREIDAVDFSPGSKDGVVELAAIAGVDLAAHWEPSEEWLGTLPKAVVVAMVTDAVGEKTAAPLAKLKKDQVAAAALPMFPERWLPQVLRGPEPVSRKKAQPRGKLAAAGDV